MTATRTSYYVRRSAERTSGGVPYSIDGWTGPIRGSGPARRERDAWRAAGWSALTIPSTPAIRAEVRAWQKAADIRHGRRPA